VIWHQAIAFSLGMFDCVSPDWSQAIGLQTRVGRLGPCWVAAGARVAWRPPVDCRVRAASRV